MKVINTWTPKRDIKWEMWRLVEKLEDSGMSQLTGLYDAEQQTHEMRRLLYEHTTWSNRISSNDQAARTT